MNCLICSHGSSTGKLFCSALNNLFGFKIIQMEKTQGNVETIINNGYNFSPQVILKRKCIYGNVTLGKTKQLTHKINSN